MNLVKSRGVYIIGYRPEEFSFSLSDKAIEEYVILRDDIQDSINKAVEQGFDTFLSAFKTPLACNSRADVSLTGFAQLKYLPL